MSYAVRNIYTSIRIATKYGCHSVAVWWKHINLLLSCVYISHHHEAHNLFCVTGFFYSFSARRIYIKHHGQCIFCSLNSLSDKGDRPTFVDEMSILLKYCHSTLQKWLHAIVTSPFTYEHSSTRHMHVNVYKLRIPLCDWKLSIPLRASFGNMPVVFMSRLNVHFVDNSISHGTTDTRTHSHTPNVSIELQQNDIQMIVHAQRMLAIATVKFSLRRFIVVL